MKIAIVILLVCAAVAHNKLRGHKKDSPIHFTSGSFEMQNVGDQDYHLDMAEAQKWDQFTQENIHFEKEGKGAGRGKGKAGKGDKQHHVKKSETHAVLLEQAPLQFIDLSGQAALISVKETDVDGNIYAASPLVDIPKIEKEDVATKKLVADLEAIKKEDAAAEQQALVQIDQNSDGPAMQKLEIDMGAIIREDAQEQENIDTQRSEVLDAKPETA